MWPPERTNLLVAQSMSSVSALLCSSGWGVQPPALTLEPLRHIANQPVTLRVPPRNRIQRCGRPRSLTLGHQGLQGAEAGREPWREAEYPCDVRSAGQPSEPPPRFRSAGDRGVLLLSTAARGGGRRLHALFSDSIHLSKLIFDIHSDLEGRHGDNSRKVENNIIATNMNYWPPG